MRKEKEVERVIVEYLSNKNVVLKEDFTESVIHEIEELGANRNKGNRGLGYLVPIVSLAFVACVMFFLPVFFSQEESIQEGNQLAIKNASITPQLEESEKILIEDLMAIPEDLNVPETFLSEQTYDLLVLLDT